MRIPRPRITQSNKNIDLVNTFLDKFKDFRNIIDKPISTERYTVAYKFMKSIFVARNVKYDTTSNTYYLTNGECIKDIIGIRYMKKFERPNTINITIDNINTIKL